MDAYADGKEVPKYIYQVEFEKPGGLVLPLIVEIEYIDGTKKREHYPAEVWRKNDSKISKVYASSQEIKSIVIDPDLETADIDVSNNSWNKEQKTQFEEFKDKVKG